MTRDEEKSMNSQLYPEWGPSHFRADDDARVAVQTAIDLRDNGGQRPDDN